jgi:hypothetical protein
MVEKFRRESEIRRIKNGLISAITAVNIRQEGRDSSEYENGGRTALEDLANPESLINEIKPYLLKDHKETIEKAKSAYPTLDSRTYLTELLKMI